MIKRIHIIGAPGSGKTYLGKKLAEYLSVPVTDLDNIVWDNNAKTYGIKISEEERNARLRDILQNPSWIIEGIYYGWLQESFATADAIILIQPNDFVRNYRIILRYIKRKLGLVKSKKETFKSFVALLKWGQSYSSEKIPAILEMTEPYQDKRYFFKTADQAFEFIISNR